MNTPNYFLKIYGKTIKAGHRIQESMWCTTVIFIFGTDRASLKPLFETYSLVPQCLFNVGDKGVHISIHIINVLFISQNIQWQVVNTNMFEHTITDCWKHKFYINPETTSCNTWFILLIIGPYEEERSLRVFSSSRQAWCWYVWLERDDLKRYWSVYSSNLSCSLRSFIWKMKG